VLAAADRDNVASVVEDDAPPFLLKQYNILAGYLGSNTQPWFLYGAGINATQRAEIMKAFYQKVGNEYIHNFNDGFDGLLNDETKAAIAKFEKEAFEWDSRKMRLVQEMKRDKPHLLTLEELDNFDFFEAELKNAGYEGIWTKRPRKNSYDGNAIFFDPQRFKLLKTRSHVLSDLSIGWNEDNPMSEELGEKLAEIAMSPSSPVRTSSDRIALLAAFEDLLSPEEDGRRRKLLVAVVHLQRNPEDATKSRDRMLEVEELQEYIQRFADDQGFVFLTDESSSAAWHMPRDGVVITGDFNSDVSKTLDDNQNSIADLEGKLWLPTSSRQRSLSSVFDLTSVALRKQMQHRRKQTQVPLDAAVPPEEDNDLHNDGCTTKTDARLMWIDHVFYSCQSLTVTNRFKDPCPDGPIPDPQHPSDHMPVAVQMEWRTEPFQGKYFESCNYVWPISPFSTQISD